MKTDLSSQITLTRIPQRYYRPENAFDPSGKDPDKHLRIGR